MRIYLAGPMSGLPHFNFPAFHTAAYTLRRQGHEVFNPAEEDIKRHNGVDISLTNHLGSPELAAEQFGFSLREALAGDFEYICRTADAIAMLPGWENSKGARAEHAAAVALGHAILYLEAPRV